MRASPVSCKACVLTLSLMMVVPLASFPATAQTWPSKPVTVINPNTPGGPIDLMGREITTRLTDVLGKPVILESKAGAGSTIAAAYVAKSAPDGHTVLIGTNAALITGPMLISPPPYDGLKDLAPVALMVNVPNIMVVHPSVPAKSLKEFVAHAKANPDKLSYASTGAGGGVHLTGALFAQYTGIDIVHVPYKGAAPALADQVGGQVQLSFLNISAPLLSLIRAGKLRALAVTALARTPALPDLPTADEQGITAFDMGSWYGFAVAARTPRPVIDALHGATMKVLNAPRIKETFLEQHGAQLRPLNPDEFGAFLRGEHERMDKLLKSLGPLGA